MKPSKNQTIKTNVFFSPLSSLIILINCFYKRVFYLNKVLFITLSLSLSLSISISIYLSLSLPLYLSLFLSLSIYLSLFLLISLYLSVADITCINNILKFQVGNLGSELGAESAESPGDSTDLTPQNANVEYRSISRI
jgi:hypothetical protein